MPEAPRPEGRDPSDHDSRRQHVRLDQRGDVAPFVTVRDTYHADGGLMAAFRGAFAVLDRLAPFWAYGLAQATGDSIEAWRELPFGDDLG